METMRRSLPRLTLLMLLPLGVAATGCWKQPGTAGLPCNSASECDDGQQCVAGLCEANTDGHASTETSASGDASTSDPSMSATAASMTDVATTTAGETNTDATTSATTGNESECPSDPSCLPSPDWVVSLGDEDSQVTIQDIAIDGTGAAIVAGHFTGSIDIGDTKLQAASYRRIFLIKFTPDGAVAWALDAGDSEDDELRAVAIDPDNDTILATGAFLANISFGEEMIMRQPQEADLFLARFKPDGTAEELFGWGAPKGQYGNDIMVLDNGDVVVVGMYQDAPDFGGGPLALEPGLGSSYNVLIARFNSSFGHVWSQGLGAANGHDRAMFAQPGPDNTIYVGGLVASQLDFPGGPKIVNMGTDDGFVARVGPGGMADWAVPIAAGGGGSILMSGLASDDDRVYVIGATNGTIQPSADVMLESAGLYDVFALALNSDGTVSWGDTYGGDTDELAGAITIDATRGHVLLSTMCRVGANFGDVDDTLSIVGNSDFCWARLRADSGAHVASARYGGKDPEPPAEFEFGGPLVTRDDALYMAGYFFGEMTIGADELSHPGMMYARPWVGRFGL